MNAITRTLLSEVEADTFEPEPINPDECRGCGEPVLAGDLCYPCEVEHTGKSICHVPECVGLSHCIVD